MTDNESCEEHAVRYRKMADQAEHFAKIAKLPYSRIEYLKLAADWRKMADQIDPQR